MKKRKVSNRGRSKTSLSSLSREPKVQNILKNLNLDSDDDDSLALNPDAPLFKTLQESLHQQLSKNYESVDINVLEFKDRKKKLKEDLEDVGYNLYNFQKRLANLHLKMRIASNAYEKNHEIRKEKEDKLITKQAEFELKSKEYDDLILKYEKLREELDILNNSIREIEEKNQNKLSDLVIMKRMAYKAEQDVKEKEISKQDQDFFINNLIEKMSDITKKIEKIESQIKAQKEETKKAQLAVYQASFEDSRLNFEREQLLKDWDSAVIGVKFRIMTLDRIQKAAEAQQNEIRALNNELQHIKSNQQEQKQVTESHMRVLKRMEDRIQSISDKISEIQKQKKKLADKSQSYMNQIVFKQNQLSNLFDEKNKLKKEFEQALANVNLLSNKVHASEEMMENRNKQYSQHEREIAQLQRAIGPLRRKIDLKKQEIIDLQNEKVRNNLVRLTLDNQCAIYQERLTGLKKGISENEELLTNLESESKENKKQIELNLKMIDKLNKRQESIRSKSNMNQDDLNPLESKLREMQDKLQKISDEGIRKQNDWIKLQTEFVQISQSSESLNKDNNQASAEVSILQRKVERTKAQLSEIQKENQKYQIHVKVSQNELDRLNKQLCSISDSTSNSNLNFDSNVIDLLQAKEKEAADIENKIEICFQTRKEIAEEKLEVEGSFEVWMKRIKMVEDLEKNFDKTKNEQELQMMKNEVRRLEESLEKIRQQQRKIVQQMQFALRRRETCKTPDYEHNTQMINEGIQRLKEMKETKDEDSIMSESLARLQMMREEPEMEAKAEKENLDNDNDNQNQQNLIDELEMIENEIYQNEQIIEEETRVKYEMQPEMAEIEEVLNEFQNQHIGFQQMIQDGTRLNKNLKDKFKRMQLRTQLLNGKTFKDDPDLKTKFENVQKQIIDMTMLLDALCFDFPSLADKFHEIQDNLSFD